MSYIPPWVTGPDKWVRVNTEEWLSINLKCLEDVDWKPRAVVLWLPGGQGCEVPETNQYYQEIINWLAQHGEAPK